MDVAMRCVYGGASSTNTAQPIAFFAEFHNQIPARQDRIAAHYKRVNKAWKETNNKLLTKYWERTLLVFFPSLESKLYHHDRALK